MFKSFNVMTEQSIYSEVEFSEYINNLTRTDKPIILTGIGARDCPIYYGEILSRIGLYLSTKYVVTLRSGRAKGSDKIFEDAFHTTNSDFELYSPFQYKIRITDTENELKEREERIYRYNKDKWSLAISIAEKHHPLFNRLNSNTKRLLTRTTFQILGPSLNNKSDLVICYTKDGVEHGSLTTKDTGGTGTAIRLAETYGVPVFNIGNDKRKEQILQFIN